MLPSLVRATVLALAVACVAPSGSPTAVVHSVYFELREPGVARSLAAACRRRLAGIPGIVTLHAGPREPSQERAPNDLRFDVALTIVFEDVEALEAYLADPRHLAVVQDYVPHIRSLRIFDSRAADG